MDVFTFSDNYFKSELSAPWGRHHREMLGSVQPGTGGNKINIESPRNSAKSTCMARFYPLHCIFYKDWFEALGMRSDKFIILVSDTEELAKKRLKDIVNTIEYNKDFMWLRGSKWTSGEIITSNDCMITALGRHSQIRGSLFGNSRPTLLIGDDLDNAEECLNPDMRLKARTWFDTDFMRAGSADGSTNFIMVDTLKHEDAISNTLSNRASWKTLFFQAIEHPKDLYHPKHERLWEEWTSIYTDMSIDDEERNRLADEYYYSKENLMTEGVVELWGDMQELTYLAVRKAICNEGYFAVMRELQNSTRDPSREMFNMEGAIRFDIQNEGLMRSDDRLVRWEDLAGLSIFLDWAGGKDSVDNCFACAVVVAWEPLPGGYMMRRKQDAQIHSIQGCHCYVVGAWLDRVRISLQIDNCFRLLKGIYGKLNRMRIRDVRFGIEDVPNDITRLVRKGLLQEFMVSREAYKMRDIELEFVGRNVRKEERIGSLEPAINNGWIAFENKLPEEFMKQMRQFPTADFMDGPDALQGATELPIVLFDYERKERQREMRILADESYKVSI